ncbi:hypothetical protein [uncultured Roseobacter sp.]|uniref:hypothetical protein n=1 Tax=uncultured Roseobacter sp. TaxID=114847 RepID=UPI0026105C9A|nr:hypothetical protein [uncultured Roseobacter sp.]
MRSYEAARGLFSFLGFCSWVVIAVGVIAALGGLSAVSMASRNAGIMQALIGTAPGIIMAVAGLYGLALVQMGRAGVDSAEYSQQSLAVARQQLEVSQQALQQGKQMAASYALQAVKQQASTQQSQPEMTGTSYGDLPKQPGMPSPEVAQKAGAAALADPNGEAAIAQLTADTFTVLGRELVFKDDRYQYQSLKFHTLEQAEAYFGQMGVNPNAKLQST